MALNNINLGKMGQNIAEMFLVKQGFRIVNRNFRTKFGEIDLIVVNDTELHFIEVKSVSRITFNDHRHYAEENVNDLKIKKIRRVGDFYINKYSLFNYSAQIDVVAVTFIYGEVCPLINFIENV